MKRVQTGIKGLDSLIGGGYPRGRSILVKGTTGSGKTIVGLHLIHRSCLDGMKCMIVATEETPEDIVDQAGSLGMKFSKYLKNGNLIIERIYEERTGHAIDVLTYGVELIDELQSNILGLLERIPDDIDIVLIDNIGVFILNMSTNEFRAQFDSLIHGLTKKNITAMVTTDLSSYNQTDGVAAYSVYGVIKTSINDNPYTGARERIIEIKKMRNTKISLDPVLFDITSNGIVFQKKT